MKKHARALAPALVGFFFLAAAPWLNAQITDPIQAHVNHSFVIGDKTLPPGDYTFRMEMNSNLSVMTVTNGDGEAMGVFPVRQAIDDHTPNHSWLVFRKYGDAEFLSKIFEAGTDAGAAVSETSKQEERFVSQGQRAVEHSEVTK
ncbi:MAG: hypothetical protein ACLPWF_26725 [Bryobacteraceae bacterium]